MNEIGTTLPIIALPSTALPNPTLPSTALPNPTLPSTALPNPPPSLVPGDISIDSLISNKIVLIKNTAILDIPALDVTIILLACEEVFGRGVVRHAVGVWEAHGVEGVTQK